MEEILVHALNRGVDKRTIFMDDHDYMRFTYGLFIFNDTRAIDVAALKRKGLTMSFAEKERRGERLVNIHAWCLMGNHFHLLLSPCREHGITQFLRKMNIGFAKYFNDRHGRVGTLFQGRTKQVPIERDAHFLHILHYIHLNPLDFLKECGDWRERKISHATNALKHLEKYKWSSFSDYCGRENFPTILTMELYKDIFKDYRGEIISYLKDMDIQALGDRTLE